MNRRGFLKTSAATAGGLLVGFYLPERTKLGAQTNAPQRLNAFVRIGSDDSVTLTIHRAELGQGSVTSLSMLLAEELECDWAKIRTEFAPVDPKNYGVFGSPTLQGVFGSLSIRSSYDSLRKAGATAREMLVTAAAQKWGVDRSQCRAENSSVVNTVTSARLSYGSLADAASKVPPPANAAVKDFSKFHLIGTSPKRLDTPLKVTGKAQYGIDVQVPGTQFAVLERCPVFGGKVASFDATAAKAVPGVRQVVQISNGVAVVADNTWSAMQGRKALKVQWNEGAMANTSSATIHKMFADLLEKPGAVALNTNTAVFGQAAVKSFDATYEAPYLSHAPMEPHSCVVSVKPDKCEIWVGTQIPSAARDAAVMITGLPIEKIDIHTYYLGGSFGRPGQHVDEAIEVAKAIGVPVKLTWTREDDMQHDIYRPASLTHFTAALDAQGWPVEWTARVVSPSFSGLQNGVDRNGVDGISTVLYDIPNIHVEYHPPEAGIPVGYWRSVGPSQNTFFTESFIDEMAVAGGKDPVALRQRLLAKSPRALAVLNLAAQKADWGKPLPAGRFRGVAMVNSLGGFNAQIAEVSIDGKGKYHVHRVVCVEDCGQVVNPAGVVQQLQGGIVFGLSALKGGITIDRGRVQQGNFDSYQVLRIDEMPVIEVHLMPSHEAPGGIGEASTPPIGPAVANALFAATKKRIRRLPIRPEDLV